MKNIILLAAFFGFSGVAFSQQEVDPAINIEKANQRCLKMSDNGIRNSCLKEVSLASFYQTEALELCTRSQNSQEDRYISNCYSHIRNQHYTGIFLRSLLECHKETPLAGQASGCIYMVNSLKQSIDGSAQGGETYRLPDDISLTISQEVVVYAGKSFGVISMSKDQDFRCDAHLNKVSVKTFDQQFPSKIIQPKGSNIILSANEVRIEIQDDAHFAAISCSGKHLTNPENRQALMEYFKSGGIGLHIPPPQKVQ